MLTHGMTMPVFNQILNLLKCSKVKHLKKEHIIKRQILKEENPIYDGNIVQYLCVKDNWTKTVYSRHV